MTLTLFQGFDVITLCVFSVVVKGCERTRIRKHLIVFSAAAPAMAVVTYVGLNQVFKNTVEQRHLLEGCIFQYNVDCRAQSVLNNCC